MDPYRGDDAWAAPGDATRRALVASLAERPRAVGELAAELPARRPAVAQALKGLQAAGPALRDQLDTCWSRALSGYEGVMAEPADVPQPADLPPPAGEGEQEVEQPEQERS